MSVEPLRLHVPALTPRPTAITLFLSKDTGWFGMRESDSAPAMDQLTRWWVVLGLVTGGLIAERKARGPDCVTEGVNVAPRTD